MKKLDGKIADVTGASNGVVNKITSAGGKAICLQQRFSTRRSALSEAMPLALA
ncbi:hypothetical protein [Nostoc sp.]